MADAKKLFDQGNLSAALKQLTQDVRANPINSHLRIFLFELLCFAGDFDRAEKQLDVIAHQNSDMQIGSAIYTQILQAEKARRAVFSGNQFPEFLTNPPEHAAYHLEALQLFRDGKSEEAFILLEKALELRPPLSGTNEGNLFHQFEDCDPFLGPFLEAIINGRYHWLPLERVQSIELIKPQHLRDLIWARARIASLDGEAGDVFLPVLYSGSSDHPEDAVRLGRATTWIDTGAGLVRGAGQRMFLIDEQECALLELTEIHFTPRKAD
jgi:type VI secretion system protein ImpE